MGLFDAIKDALTTDDAERLAAAQKGLEKAQADFNRVKQEVGTKADPASREKLEKAEQAVAEARAEVEGLAAKTGTDVPDPGADAAASQASAEADAQAQRDADAVARMKEQQAQYAQEQAGAQAAPVEAEPLAAEPQYREYTVVKGDTLSEIGQRFGVKWRDIAALNDIKNPDLIHPGQVFRIPNA